MAEYCKIEDGRISEYISTNDPKPKNGKWIKVNGAIFEGYVGLEKKFIDWNTEKIKPLKNLITKEIINDNIDSTENEIQQVINTDQQVINTDQQAINTDQQAINTVQQVINEEQLVTNKDQQVINEEQLVTNEDQQVINEEQQAIIEAQQKVIDRLTETMDKLLGYIASANPLTAPQQQFVDDFRNDYADYILKRDA